MSKKYIVALILNIIPFFLSCPLYEGGIAILMMYPILQFLINGLNYKWTNKVISYLFLNIAMFISSIASIEIITHLYYNNISSDNGTLAVGGFAVIVGVVFMVLMTLISIIYRNIINKNLKQ